MGVKPRIESTFIGFKFLDTKNQTNHHLEWTQPNLNKLRLEPFSLKVLSWVIIKQSLFGKKKLVEWNYHNPYANVTVRGTLGWETRKIIIDGIYDVYIFLNYIYIHLYDRSSDWFRLSKTNPRTEPTWSDWSFVDPEPNNALKNWNIPIHGGLDGLVCRFFR